MNEIPIPDDAVLCYVSGPWAYFTTQMLAEQWGDDWDDVPYEHNAGRPYEPCWHNRPESNRYPCDCRLCKKEWNEDGTPKWRIFKAAFDGPMEQPHVAYSNSPYSVEMLNEDLSAPWLRSPSYADLQIRIYGGLEFSGFVRLVEQSGGSVYTPAMERSTCP